MPLRLLSWLLCLALSLAACSEGLPTVELLFDRASFDVRLHPFPSDRWKQGYAGAFNEQELTTLPFLSQMMAIQRPGFAPTTSIRLPFSPFPNDSGQWLETSSIEGALRLHHLPEDGGAVEVELGEITVNYESNSITLRPRSPFAPGRYAVTVLAHRLRTRSGDFVRPSKDYQGIIVAGDPDTDSDFDRVSNALQLSQGRADTLSFFTITISEGTTHLESLRKIVRGQLPVVEGSTPPEFLALGDEGITLSSAYTVVEGSQIPGWLTQNQFGELPSNNIGTISTGMLTSPNLLSPAINDWNSLQRNQTIQTRNPLNPPSETNPVRLGTPSFKALPYLVTMPRVRLSPMPVIVAIHGITRSKEDWLSFANAASTSGYALIAIDLYQHGQRQSDISPPEGHVTDNLDAALANLGVSFPDPFINPNFLARTRDKLNQSMVDVLSLLYVLESMSQGLIEVDLDGDGTPDSIGKIHLIGHSLGAILGINVAAVSPEISRAVFAAPGANVAQIMADSPELSTTLNLMLYATASTPGVGLLSGSRERLLPQTATRELLTIVSEHILAEVEAGLFATKLLQRGKSSFQSLIFFSSEDPVITHPANDRLIQAILNRETTAGEVVALGQQYLPFDLPTQSSPNTVITIRQLLGGHSAFLDFVRERVTSTAHQQAMQFFTAR